MTAQSENVGRLLGNAPTSWGIEKPSDPSYPPWTRVLDEIAGAGYTGTELGPYGFLPTDPQILRRELERRSLALSAGTVMEPFHVPKERPRILRAAEETCRYLALHRARHVVIIGTLVPEREASAGRNEAAPRLAQGSLETAVETIDGVISIARELGVDPVLHPHAGTYLEFRDEIEAVKGMLGDRVNFCVDVGHSAYAGMDPARLIGELTDNVTYVHLKDVNPQTLERARRERLGFWEAYRAGIFCVVGRGLVDFHAVFGALEALGYAGWFTVEQDAAPDGSGTVVEDARASRQFVEATYQDLRR
jgi:inosose dehydratase